MAKQEKIDLLIEGGKATPAPPIGPRLSPLGVNIPKIVAEINEKTKMFEGTKVPVKIIVNVEQKTWEIEVGTPPASQLLFKELKIPKGSGAAGKESPANVSKEIVIKIAKMKLKDTGSRSLKSAVKTVIGTCLSSGLKVDGKDPREVQKEIDQGAWDSLLALDKFA